MSDKISIRIDRAHDGSFSDAGDDISDSVIGLGWRLGLRGAYESLAASGEAQIRLRDRDGAFSPERHALDIGTRVRIIWGASTPLFTGHISHIDIDGGDYGDGDAVIHLRDLLPWLDESQAMLSPTNDVTADAVIDRLLDAADTRRALIAGFCIIDVPGYNQIGSVRPFSTPNIASALQPGKTRFSWVGDWWTAATTVLAAIRDVVESERGRFFVDRRGRAVFLNRHHTLLRRAPSATFSDDMSGMLYSFGAGRVNQVRLLMTPREIGSSGTVLWQLSSPQLLPPASETTLELRFVDATGNPLSLLSLEKLEAVFHRNGKRRGLPLEQGVSAKALQVGFTTALVALRNESSRPCYLSQLRLIGVPLHRGDPLEITLSDGAGIHLHGIRQLRLDLPALSDLATANAFAAYELARRAKPAGEIRELRLNAREHPGALSLSLFDRIRVSETRTGQRQAEYFIVGESHEVSHGGAFHEIRFTLEPADLARFVLLDSSRVDDAAERIAPF